MATTRTDKTQQRGGPPSGPAGESRHATRRIAGGTAARAVGEAVAKAASVVFYIAIARKLGEASFGDFIFGLSLAGVLMTMAGFGTDELIAREVARDRERVHQMFANTLALKTALGVVVMGVIALILVVGGYASETRIAVLLLSVAVWIEVLTKTVQAVLQGNEEMKYIAASLIVQRVSVAIVGVVVLLRGGELIAVSAVMVGGSVLGLVSALYWLYRRVHRPRRELDRSRWASLIKAGVPLGLVAVLYLVLLRLDATLLSFLKGGDNTEVGQYGAAYRLIEATMFVSWAFAGAALPWFSRYRSGGTVSLARGYELGLKALVAMLVPVAVVFGVLAAPLIELLYGTGYSGSVLPLQLLAAMTVLYGFNNLIATLMISRNRPGAFAVPAAIVIVQNVIFNFILIPPFGATGAATNAVISGLLLGALTFRNATRLAGRISLVRALTAPLLAAAALAGVLVLTGEQLSVSALVAGGLAYAAVFLGVERLAFAGDFRLYLDLVKRRRAAADQGVPPPAPLATPGALEP
ncbi:MAG TPA: flippase [Solirubrobacterales bacterium]|nr:flippase [Solirubrobacterales bacterium]